MITKARGIESKPVDLFASFSMFFQQVIYFFKMVIPAICITKEAKNKLTNKDISEKLGKDEVENLKILRNKYQKLSLLGIVTFSSSALNTFFKPLHFENPIFQKTKLIVEGLAGDLISKFFSERRHDMGFKFRAENPELYEKIVEEKSSDEDVVSQNGKKDVEIITLRSKSTQPSLEPESN